MLGACTPKQSRRFFSREAAAFCCIGFPFGGSCQWPRPLTDEGQVRQYSPFAEWPHGRGRACPARGLTKAPVCGNHPGRI